MTIFFTDEEKEYLVEEPFNWHASDDAPPQIKKSIERKLAKQNSENTDKPVEKKMKARSFSDRIKKSKEPEEAPAEAHRFKIAKMDDDKMLAFGWANVSIRTDGELIEDWQKDIIEPEELERAAYNFVELYREGGEMHERGGAAVLVESVVFTEEKMKAMGIPEGTLPVGWWIGFHVIDDDVWEKVKDGTYSMFSIEGEAERIEVGEGEGTEEL